MIAPGNGHRKAILGAWLLTARLMARMDHHPTFKKAMQKRSQFHAQARLRCLAHSPLMKRESSTTKTNCKGNAMIPGWAVGRGVLHTA